MPLLGRAVKGFSSNVQRILDAGCGEASQTHEISIRFNASVLGVTPFKGELEACRLKKTDAASQAYNPFAQVDFQLGGSPGFEGVEGQFEIIYSDAAFHYMKSDEERAATWQRWAELLSPHGRIALRSPSDYTFSPDCETPDLDSLVREAYNASSRLKLIDARTVGDTLREKRPERDLRMHELIFERV